jgi:hypothetical protein
VAHAQRRIRTVVVRVRCVMLACARSSGVRRLLVIGGMTVAGWLLGSAGGVGSAQAHADTLPVPTPASAPALAPAPGVPVHVLGAAEDLTGGGDPVPGAVSAPRKVTGDLARTVCEVRCTLPVRPSTVLDPPRDIARIVTDLAPTRTRSDRTDAGVSWTPRRHHGVGADAGDRAGAEARRAPVVTGASKGGRSVVAAALSHPAPMPGVPMPPSPQAGALLPAAGSSLIGGALAHLSRTGSITRTPLVRVPLPGAVPPAAHSATDEPSFSPD